MTVPQKDFLKMFAVFKSETLIVSYSPYNWFETGKFSPLLLIIIITCR
jgi:hypothetical protein